VVTTMHLPVSTSDGDTLLGGCAGALGDCLLLRLSMVAGNRVSSLLVRYLEFESDDQGVSHYFQDSVLIFKNS
jgi:hypothetical protein